MLHVCVCVCVCVMGAIKFSSMSWAGHAAVMEEEKNVCKI
jgi:hypothetical protein